jgi:hypothetical protein
MAWFEQDTNYSDSWDSPDQYHKKDATIQALDAMFAQYGR